MRKMTFVVAVGARRWGARCCLWLAALLTVCGCSTSQKHDTVTIGDKLTQTLKPGELQAYGIAFITPASVTGQEEDRPALSLVFTETLAELRPAVRVIPLNETLSAISRAGISEDYKLMMVDSRDSGLLNRSTLSLVSKATGVRYVAQLKMASFHQDSEDRFSVLGLRLVQTKKADIRVFLRIWDGDDGTIVWEGAYELYMAKETMTESAVSFRNVVEEAARQLINRLP